MYTVVFINGIIVDVPDEVGEELVNKIRFDGSELVFVDGEMFRVNELEYIGKSTVSQFV